MSKVSNVITMLGLLQTGKKYSINELSNKLEVSERMIRVYKEDLEKAGIYIDTIMGPYGGYVLNQNVKLPQRFVLKCTNGSGAVFICKDKVFLYWCNIFCC